MIIHHPAPHRFVLGAVALLVLLSAAKRLGGCADATHLNPTGAEIVDTLVAEACPLEAMIPSVGPALVLTCPGQEAAVAAEVARHERFPSDAGAAPAAQSLIVNGRRVGVRIVPTTVLPDAGAEGGR
jgi:hypothetical protein